MAIEQSIAELVQASNKLTGVVDGKVKEIDNKVLESKTKVDDFIGSARGELSHVLLSRNQIMEPTTNGDGIKGFSTIGLDSFEVIKEATIHASSTSDVDHTGNGYAAEFRKNVHGGYVNRAFHILRLKWTRGTASHPARIDNNWNNGYQQGALTSGCYLKILSGDISGDMTSIHEFSNDWHFYGMRQGVNSLNEAFHGGHSKLALSSAPGGSGEMLICLFGTVSGVVNYEKKTWGLYPEFARISDV
ncbi:hypothetical protein FR932_07020 [Moritella marina ATCC 15381]|uniref:Uncharacterized protein n=1 Tax=Moritella marina ATCC 15381 TaxID=1202962 RepID=A0A5J6WK68_MORMI|nr:hypothetical protein [Moritella marina]QFI37611.1 hypothetical protein FR932_07020 [Moritella marina ATCC 15381]